MWKPISFNVVFYPYYLGICNSCLFYVPYVKLKHRNVLYSSRNVKEVTVLFWCSRRKLGSLEKKGKKALL